MINLQVHQKRPEVRKIPQHQLTQTKPIQWLKVIVCGQSQESFMVMVQSIK